MSRIHHAFDAFDLHAFALRPRPTAASPSARPPQRHRSGTSESESESESEPESEPEPVRLRPFGASRRVSGSFSPEPEVESERATWS